jgi:penicillin-binding protein 1C
MVYEFWPSDLLRIFQQAGIQRRVPPPYDVGCALNAKGERGFVPQIVSPQTQLSYVVSRSNGETVVPFTAVVDGDVRVLHWFLDETYLGQTARDQPFLWQAKSGHFTVRVVDDAGRADAREMVVKLVS